MSTFKFKQFTVQQDRCAQKIGTDGTLLAAWVNPRNAPSSILDIGTGTGVMALMLAQRFPNTEIEALEIDAAAYEQATDNFERSPWRDRMFCFHASFQEFFESPEQRYDLIISNPPFFEQKSLKGGQPMSKERQQARFDDSLAFEDLVYGVYQLLEQDGTFACIIPQDRAEHLLEITAHFGFIPLQMTAVRGREDLPVKRYLMAFSFRESVPKKDQITLQEELVIEKSRHDYTPEYIELTKDFYLKM